MAPQPQVTAPAPPAATPPPAAPVKPTATTAVAGPGRPVTATITSVASGSSDEVTVSGNGVVTVAVVAGLIILGILVVVLYWFIRKKQKRAKRERRAALARERGDKTVAVGKEGTKISLPTHGSTNVMAWATDEEANPALSAHIPGSAPPRPPPPHPQPQRDDTMEGDAEPGDEDGQDGMTQARKSHFSMDSDDSGEGIGSRTRSLLSRISGSRKSKGASASAPAVPPLSTMPSRPPQYAEATTIRPGPTPLQRSYPSAPAVAARPHQSSETPIGSDERSHDGGTIDLDDISMQQGSND